MKNTLRYTVAVSMIAALLFVLTSCLVPVVLSYELHTEGDEIKNIEIFKLDETEDYISAEKEPVAAVPAEEYGEFCAKLNDLMDFDVTLFVFPAAADPNFRYSGYVVRITYISGAVEDVCYNGVQNYESASGHGTVGHVEINKEKWESFLGEYLPAPTE